jgi:DNA-binding NtrC family response regulator/tetratricopeptide (TPR) repeat protein/energy-coupling factor transporter ATP-binding protein EcfA2
VASRFAVDKLLGSGGQGRVFSVRDAARRGQQLALKEAEPGLFSDLVREFGLLSRLNHPHLVAVYDFFSESPLAIDGEVPGAAYTQEFVDGRDLFSVCRQAGTAEKELLFEQIFQALAYLHALDVVHCDLKPENVMVEEDGGLRARLLDFGIARQGAAGPTGIRGSKSYIAPEVLNGGPVEPSADLYGLGVMMAEAWLGRTPSPEELSGALRDRRVRREYLAKEGVPASWCDVVVSLLEQNPSHRPASIAEAAAIWSSGLGRSIVLQTPATTASMLRAGPLVGRDLEMRQALAALEHRDNVALTGPPGVGKSTLAKALMRRLQEQGTQVEWWGDAIQGVTLASLGETLGRLLDVELKWDTVDTVPEAGRNLVSASPAESLSARFTEWLHSETNRLVAQLPTQGESHSVLFVEGIDALSPLLKHLVNALYERSQKGQLPLRFVVTAESASFTKALALGPLSRSAAQALVGTRLGHSAASERLGAVLAAASGGNPLLIENLLALLVERQELSYDQGRWELVVEPEAIRLPGSAAEAINERVLLLSEAAQAHLSATVWIEFPTRPNEIGAVLGSVCQSLTLLELDAAGLLWRGSDNRISVAHPAVSVACAGWQPPDGVHRARERLLTESSLSLLGRAWHLGGDSGCMEAMSVADQEWIQGDMGRAARAVRVALHCDAESLRALKLGAKVANITGPREWQVQCLELLLEKGSMEEEDRLLVEADLFWALTRIGDTERAEEIGKELLLLARKSGHDLIYVDALIHMANTQIQRGDYGQGRASLVDALARGKNTRFMARILNNLGNVELYEGNFEEALGRYTEAYDLKRAEGDPIGTRIALGNMGLMCFELGRYEEALEHFAKSRLAAVETGHIRGQAWSLLGLAVLGLKAGAFDYAKRRASQACELAEGLGDRVVAWDATGTLVEIALARGDGDEALLRSQESLEKFGDVDSPFNLAGARSVRALALMTSQEHEARVMAANVFSDNNIKDGTIRAHAARVLCETALAAGDLDQVAATIRSVLDEKAWKLPIQTLLSFESAARLVGEREVIATIHRASHQALEAGHMWPQKVWSDGVDEWAESDGPCQATFEAQEAVVQLRSKLQSQEEVTMNPLKAIELAEGWTQRLANASAEELDACLSTYIREVVQERGAERGFILDSDGTLLTSADVDGEVVAGAEGKVPDGVLALVAKSQAAYRADSSHGQKGTLCALPAFAGGSMEGVLILQNRFVADAFTDVRHRGGGDDVLGLILRLRSLVQALAKTRAKIASNEGSRRKEQTRSTEEILRLRKELENTRELLSPVNNYSNIVFKSSAMKKMLRRLDRVVDSALPVYVHGESGSGKELVARAIHAHGPRQKGPFVAQNCSAIPTTLFESEFFGHERGAFTGAERASEGLFRRASGGTLFLDEIGDLPLDLQSKLLRVLETSEVRAVGGQKTHRVDVRIICATHRDLAQQVERKRFREDLFYRLNVVRLDVPPLRERPDDIPLLVAHFMEVHRQPNKPLPEFKKGVMKAFVSYGWPGNVRQLENEVIRAALLSDGVIGVEDLSPEVLKPAKALRGITSGALDAVSFPDEGTLKERVDRLEAHTLKHCLSKYGGNKSQVARELGLSRAGLNMKLKRLQLWDQE